MCVYLLTGNQTVEKYLEEEVMKSFRLGPNIGMFVCDKTVLPSGPHYVIVFICKIYNTDENGHMKMVSIDQ